MKITAQFTNFVQSSTLASFGAGVSVGGAAEGSPGTVAVTSPTTANAQLTINGAASGRRDVTVQTGVQTASLPGAFAVTPATVAILRSPISIRNQAFVGCLITVTGINLTPNAGTSALVSLNKQGGGSISAPVGTSTATTIPFTVPPGAATGLITVTVNGQSPTSSTPLTIVPSSNFTLTVGPSPANLIQGQSVPSPLLWHHKAQFNQLAALSVTGLPSGVTAAFKPPNITAGQTSVLTLTAPANQPIATSNLSVSAAATVDGLPVTQTAPACVVRGCADNDPPWPHRRVGRRGDADYGSHRRRLWARTATAVPPAAPATRQYRTPRAISY